MSFKLRYLELTETRGGPYSLLHKGIKRGVIDSIMRGSIPRADRAQLVAETLGTTVEWLVSGATRGRQQVNEIHSVSEPPPLYEREIHTQEEKEVIAEYRAASDNGQETGRMVFRMNPKNQKKPLLRRKTDIVRQNAG